MRIIVQTRDSEMAVPATIDPRSGYCAETRTFHSLRPPSDIPPETEPLSAAEYTVSLLPSPLPVNPAVVDAATGASLSFPEFIAGFRALTSSLRAAAGLRRGDVAFVLSPPRVDVPVLYHALLSLGVVVAPSNPLSTVQEVSRQLQLTPPSIAFTTSDLAHKIPANLPAILLDSPRFRSMLAARADQVCTGVRQENTAAVLYSSGTTGRMKGVVLTHRNFISLIAGFHAASAAAAAAAEVEGPVTALFTIPLFHVFGFFMVLRAVSLGETMVLMGKGRFDFVAMLRAVEAHRVTYMPVSPPLVLMMAKSEEVANWDLSSLKLIACGGAPLGREVSERFAHRFPGVQISQGYGLTESTGGASSMVGEEEMRVYGSAGRIRSETEAKIVDPATGEALAPGRHGELWLRGPTIMKGYIGEDEATSSTLDSDGWLKTGDLCYFDHDGFLFIVDRLKELIKYKAYQVPPAELEHILQSHREIADAAVIPYPDEAAGQIPMAYVVRQPGSSISKEQIMDFVMKQVAPYKKVRRVTFVSSIPKSPAGKILRRELINHATLASASKL